MTKITEVDEGDTGLAARTKINTAMSGVSSSTKLSGDGNVGTELTVDESNVDHDQLENFVGNEHIDWTDTNEDFKTSGEVNAGTFVGALTTLADPAGGSINTALVDEFTGVVITLTTTPNNQTIADPTDVTGGRAFTVINDDASTGPIIVNNNPIQAKERVSFAWDGSTWTSNLLGLQSKSEFGSSVQSGMLLSATLGGTTFDISSGVYQIVDNYTDPLNPKINEFFFAGSTGNALPDIATQPVTIISLDASGDLVLSLIPPVGELIRDAVFLGAIAHQDLATVTNVSNSNVLIGHDLSVSLSDLLGNVFPLVSSDSDFSHLAAASDLTIQRTAGISIAPSINRVNRKDPHRLVIAADAVIANFSTTWRDGAGGFHVEPVNSAVTVGVFDDNAVQGGTPSEPAGSVTNNNWVNHRIFFSASTELTIIQYGQNTHSTSSSAMAALQTESFTLNPLLNTVLFRGWITVRGAASDLSSDSDAIFTIATKFGATGSGGGAPVSQTMQAAYDNSTQTQILTDATRGAVQYQRGSALDTDDVIEVLNGAGGQVAAITGEGALSILDQADLSGSSFPQTSPGTFTYPSSDGAAGESLQTDGSGTLTFEKIANSGRMGRTSNQAINTATWTIADSMGVSFDDLVIFTAATGLLTIPAGVTRIKLHAGGVFDHDTRGTRRIQISKNGNTSFASNIDNATSMCQDTTSSGEDMPLNVSTGAISVTTNDTFEVAFWQNTTATRQLETSWLAYEILG